MSKEFASADLQAAAYWKSVARSDKAEINVAVVQVSELTAAAKREMTKQDGPALPAGPSMRLLRNRP